MQINPIEKKCAIVLGANGYFGKNLCYHLLCKGYQVIAVGRQEAYALDSCPNRSNLKYLRVDLTNLNYVQNIEFNLADVVYMLAGKTGTLNAFEQYEEYVASNEISLLNVLAAYRLQKAKARIVFPSTRLVYEGADDPLLEDATKNPKTIYAINKLSCEHYLHMYSIVYGIPYTVMRICVPYGSLVEGEYSYGTIGTILRQARDDREIILFGNGLQRRTFTHMQDICQILGKIWGIEDSNKRIFNIGGSDHLSMDQVAQYFADRFIAELIYKDWPADHWAIESGSTVFDDRMLQTICPHVYENNLADYIANI